MSDGGHNKLQKQENPILALGFWEFAIISTLMRVFFPWSLLFCVMFYGLNQTKFIILALLHDFLKTILAILSILVPTAIGLVLLILGLDG